MTATRRTVINWADSAFAITTLPAAASASDDPTFALLDAHRKAEHPYYTLHSTEVDGKDDPALLQQFTDLGDEVDELAWDIARNEPSPIAGVAAVLRYVSNTDPDGGQWPHQEYGWPGTLNASLARALKRIVR
jgi:transglutaminase-like putative cysteine protease